ncbi:pituitary tumor-transforming gene 1 protein-interacting protein-like [Oscarella lobularis]|uniref:pituitary tumor-transforming gene 1 protein-interacting protein-like n=1 Tax=Oscarella lobularis TaxID=121494 RepID=UPI003314259B
MRQFVVVLGFLAFLGTVLCTDCGDYDGVCGQCLSFKCHWCSNGTKNAAGDGLGTCGSNFNPSSCDGTWFVLTCSIRGIIWVSLAGVGAGIFLFLVIGCTIYCCCCRGKSRRQRKMRKEDMEDQHRRREMKERHDDRRSERRARNDAIRKKYGLYKDDDDQEEKGEGRYQRFD